MGTSLGDRLRQVITGAVPRVAADALPTGSLAQPIRSTRIESTRVADMLGGQSLTSNEGELVVVDRYYAPDRSHGRQRIGDLVDTLESGGDALGVLARAWPQRRAGRDDGNGRQQRAATAETYSARLCFFDLETTGLAGGAGTQAFLVGCAVIEDGGLHVRQFLLPGFEHERALLTVVGVWMAAQGTLVTFNGRSFDVPLIETRYLLHRLPFPLATTPHLDMLHPSRRLWKERPSIAGPPLDEESCRLSVLERHLAGYHRIGDVPGFEIPSRYFRFVRNGDARPLEAVLEHNRIDLLSLALVTARALTLIRHGPLAAAHPRECLGLGRLYERAGRPADAEPCYARAVSLAALVGREPDVEAEALRRLALCRRRAGRLAEAAETWQALADLPGCPSVLRREAREALAIHHEHRSRDLSLARRLVLDVLAETPPARWREQAQYRLRRIDRKLGVRTTGELPMEFQ